MTELTSFTGAGAPVNTKETIMKNKSEDNGPYSEDELELLTLEPEEEEQAVEEEPYDDAAWHDPGYELEKQQHEQWLKGLLDLDMPDPHARVVSLGWYIAAVFEGGDLRIVRENRSKWLSFFFDPSGYTDEQLVDKLKKYVLFS